MNKINMRDNACIKLIMVYSCKVLSTVIDSISTFVKRNADFIWQLQYTSNNNQFDTYIATYVDFIHMPR